MSNLMKDTGKELFNWWKQDKISGSILPVFLALNLTKATSNVAYSYTELIANLFMLLIMFFSIAKYYKRMERSDVRNKEKEVELEEVKAKQEVELEKIKLERDKFEQKKSIEDFAKDVITKQRTYQYNLIMENSDFINQQIVDKTDHIVYLSENFPADEKVKFLIDIHKKEIENLRAQSKELPLKIEMKFKEYISKVNIPQAVIEDGSKVMKEELDIVIDEINKNIEMEEIKEDIKAPAPQEQ